MDFIVADTYEDMSRKAADVIAGCLATKPDCVLGLATGSDRKSTRLNSSHRN